MRNSAHLHTSCNICNSWQCLFGLCALPVCGHVDRTKVWLVCIQQIIWALITFPVIHPELWKLTHTETGCRIIWNLHFFNYLVFCADFFLLLCFFRAKIKKNEKKKVVFHPISCCSPTHCRQRSTKQHKHTDNDFLICWNEKKKKTSKAWSWIIKCVTEVLTKVSVHVFLFTIHLLHWWLHSDICWCTVWTTTVWSEAQRPSRYTGWNIHITKLLHLNSTPQQQPSFSPCLKGF